MVMAESNAYSTAIIRRPLQCAFEDVGFKFEKHACNGCHDFLTKAYSLENIAIMSTKGATLGVFCGVLVKMKV